MKVLIYILAIVSFYTTVHAELQCYVCTNCPTPSDDDVQACAALTTTIAPTTDDESEEPTTADLPGQTGQTTEPTTAGSTESTTAGSTETTVSTEPPTTDPTGTDRPIVIEPTFPPTGEKCTCAGTCECHGKDNAVRFVESIAPRDLNFECYTHTHTVDGNEVIDRGCKEVSASQTACDVLGVSEGCEHCNTDRCNSAFNLQFSIGLLLCTLFVLYF